MSAPSKKPPLVVPASSRRELIIAIGAGVILAAFIIFGISRMGNEASGRFLTGEITEKHFEPLPETRISLGSAGLVKENIAGDYRFNVRVPGDRDYTVWIDKVTYDARSVGDSFRFPRPPEAP